MLRHEKTGRIMTHNRKKLVATALATSAAPAMLLLGTGTAHAAGIIFSDPDPFGTTVIIQSDGATFGNCTYNASPRIGPGIPSGPRPFFLPNVEPRAATLWFPGIRLNTTWDVKVTCDNGPDIVSTVVY